MVTTRASSKATERQAYTSSSPAVAIPSQGASSSGFSYITAGRAVSTTRPSSTATNRQPDTRASAPAQAAHAQQRTAATSTTTDITVAPAVHTVMHNYELLQQIIIFLPSANIVRVQRVSTAWRDLATSTAVRKSRCIEPAEIAGTDSIPEDAT